MNLNNVLPEGEGVNYVQHEPFKQDIKYMVKTALAFGGHNNVLIFKKFE